MNGLKKLFHGAFFLMIILAFSAHSLTAQEVEKRERMDKIINKISYKLDLSEDQKVKFAPLYERFWNERKAIMQEGRPKRGDQKVSELSDAELEQLIKRSIDMKRAMIDHTERYSEEFKKVLSMKQLAKLHMMEDRLKDKMKKKLKERRGKMKRER